jgi:cytochrome c
MFLLGCCAALTMILRGAEPEDGLRGREIYEKRCAGCHALDRSKVGPPLRGVFGRRVASDPRFPYSDALKKTQFVWGDAQLDRWLADPDGLIPDNDMSFRLDNAEERSAVIAYLKQLPAKGEERQ